MDNNELQLTDREFERVRARVQREAGISLSEAKRTLVVSRLGKIVRALELESIDAYLDYLEFKGDADAAQEFVNALTTNLTRFYREEHHFDHLQRHVEALIAKRPRASANGRPRLRIWSAGCSTGQEPYTIGMCLMARFPELRHWDFKILATDIDTKVIEKASVGIYPAGELSGLSRERAAMFEKVDENHIRVPQAVRSLIAFRPLNLFGEWPFRGPFDAVFCRNVAIYFDKPTQLELFARLGSVLAKDGVLYIGHSERLGGAGDFRLVGKTIYQRQVAKSSRDAA